MNKRFFAPDSFWNQPIGPNPAIDPLNDRYLEALAGAHGGPFWINILDYTIPVYAVDERTPRHTVHQRPIDPGGEERRMKRWGPRATWFQHGPGFGKDVPIPAHAMPDPESDGHMALIDYRRGRAWDMWGCRRRADGGWESYTGMAYDLNGSGVWRTDDFPVQDGESIHFHGPGRAAGVPIIAGLFMYAEVRAGHIPHKLAFATWHNALKQFVAPATWTDGFRDFGLPEGAVMQLDPALQPAHFGLSPAASVIFRALQEYGMVNVDCARANTFYGEGLYGQPDQSWDGILRPDEFKRVPLECYRVLRLPPITAMGDGYRPPAD